MEAVMKSFSQLQTEMLQSLQGTNGTRTMKYVQPITFSIIQALSKKGLLSYDYAACDNNAPAWLLKLTAAGMEWRPQ
jgi:hypothetical protein